MKIHIFPSKYHQNGGFPWAMLVSGRVSPNKKWCFSSHPSFREVPSMPAIQPYWRGIDPRCPGHRPRDESRPGQRSDSQVGYTWRIIPWVVSGENNHGDRSRPLFPGVVVGALPHGRNLWLIHVTNQLLKNTGMILQVWHARVSLNAWKIGDKLIPPEKKRILIMDIYRQLI